MNGKALFSALLLSLSTCAYGSYEKGQTALNQGNETQAIDFFKAAESDTKAQLALAKLYTRRDLDEAEEWIEKALESAPDNPEVYFTLGVIRGNQAQDALFSALSLAKKSKRAFEKAVALAPQSVVYLRGLFQYHVNAPSIAGGSKEEAKAIADRIKAIDPVEGVLADIDLTMAQGDSEQTQALVLAALEAHPGNVEVNYKAGLYYQAEEDFDSAFSTFETAAKAIEVDAQKVNATASGYAAMYQLGRTAVFSDSRHVLGIQALQRYISDAPESADLPSKAWAEFRMADLMEKNGQREQALAIYRQLLKVDDKDLRKQVKGRI